MSETIGQILQQTPRTPEEIRRKKLFEDTQEAVKKKIGQTITDITVTKLGTNIGGDFHRKTKIIRLSEKIDDVDLASHVIIHELEHKDFEKNSKGIAIIDNDINEALTEVTAGKKSQQGPQTYKKEIQKLRTLQAKTGENLIEHFRTGNAKAINKIIVENDDKYLMAA